MVGSANNINAFSPSRPNNPFDTLLCRLAHFFHNAWWVNQTIATQDFFGLNYYFHHPLRYRFTSLTKLFAPQTANGVPKSDLGWEIYPEGLGKILRWLHSYRKPIIITENGIADAADEQRETFIRNHVAEIERALTDGIDVRGYFYWSLLDNFEWREGFTPKFGLIAVDRQTQNRVPRQSAYVYRDLIATLQM